MSTSSLLSPALLAGMALRNRLVLAAMSRMQAQADGSPSPGMPAYYARYAREGVGLLMTEAIYTDDSSAKAYFSQPGLTSTRHVEGWRRVVQGVHAADGKIFAQLQHGGRLCEPELNPLHLSASEGVAAGQSWQTGEPNRFAQAATQEQIDAIVAGFANCATHARSAGFDGIEIHGARGYLVDDFLSASSNRREDAYGGSVENRCRLALEILKAVRQAAPGLPVSFNFSLYKMDDSRYSPPGGAAEVAEIAQRLQAGGADMLHLTTRKVMREEAWGASFVATVREAVPNAVLIINGGIADLAQAEQALNTVGAQAVSLARPLLANPDLIARTNAGLDLNVYAPGDERRPLHA
jgi:2,4-dienoyl-CoA reductase-like NADH-dependent reductase (Old Yellow Enzyme family)